jgi:hypothetical protein
MDCTWVKAARLALVIMAVLVGVCGAAAGYAAGSTTAASAAAGAKGGPLTGAWSGALTGQSRGGVQADRIVIVVNARESSGSWKLSATCYGRLTLDGISGGYHHYRRKVSPRATCAGGDVDCLKRVGANLYDAVTSHLGGANDLSGTLRRVRPH